MERRGGWARAGQLTTITIKVANASGVVATWALRGEADELRAAVDAVKRAVAWAAAMLHGVSEVSVPEPPEREER